MVHFEAKTKKLSCHKKIQVSGDKWLPWQCLLCD